MSRKAVNLLLLTRIHDRQSISLLLQAMSGRKDCKAVSSHEAASLWSLADTLTDYFRNQSDTGPEDWLFYLDGFYFSYVIEHIGKEFDLLKISADGGYVLNIELKSVMIEEERIKKQLEQNRYYLSHIAHTIYSYTYVMETGRFFNLNDRGFLRECEAAELAGVLMKDTLWDFLGEGIGQYFRAANYLISPVATPEKFLQGQYFLTNQQAEFRRSILNLLQEHKSRNEEAPVIAISGIAGTGKTLLLLDLALQLSKKNRVLFLHSGSLRQGHLTIDSRLKNVDIRSVCGVLSESRVPGYEYLLVDEADHLEAEVLDRILSTSRESNVPVVVTCDPHQLLSAKTQPPADQEASEPAAAFFAGRSFTLVLSFTGNIRINRPVYSFLRTLLCLKNRSANADYDCIELLYANDTAEQTQIAAYCKKRGFELVSTPDGGINEADIIAREYDKVLIIMDDRFYYDETLHLRVRENEEDALRLLYEGLSRTRENLCLLVTGNRELFAHLLTIKLGDDGHNGSQSVTFFV